MEKLLDMILNLDQKLWKEIFELQSTVKEQAVRIDALEKRLDRKEDDPTK